MALIILPSGSTSVDLQTAVDQAVFGDIIELSGDMPFISTVIISQGLEITINSVAGSNWSMQNYVSGSRHFEINGSLIIENITLDGRNNGGGVQLNLGAFAMLNGSVIQNCTSTNGGGVYVIAGVFSLYGGEIRYNNAQNGGGVYLTSGLVNMSASTGIIHENKAVSGGGVYINNGTFRMTGGEISSNEADNGGGLYLSSGSFSMSRGIFANNIAAQNGGGIHASSSSTVELIGTTTSIVNNTALSGSGGGIFTNAVDYSNLSTSGVTFRCNKALTAFVPPMNAGILYPNIQFAEATVLGHPLNNYDINNTVGRPITVTHRVTYNANCGIGHYTGMEIGPCETDIVLSIEDTGIRRDGYIFNGWNTSTDGSGIAYMPGDIITLTENVILYAQWISDGRLCRGEFCEKFCMEFCGEFCCEFLTSYSRSCCDTCCDSCYDSCCKICSRISSKACRNICES